MESLKQSNAARRKAHFAAGGSPRSWVPLPKKLDESRSKAKQSKQACRNWQED